MTWIIDDENTGLSTTCSGSFQPSCASAYAASNLSYSSGVYSPSPSPSPSSIDAGARHLGGGREEVAARTRVGPRVDVAASTPPRQKVHRSSKRGDGSVRGDGDAGPDVPSLEQRSAARVVLLLLFRRFMLHLRDPLVDLARDERALAHGVLRRRRRRRRAAARPGSSPSAAVGAFIALNRYPVSSAQSAFERPSPTTLRRRRVLARGGLRGFDRVGGGGGSGGGGRPRLHPPSSSSSASSRRSPRPRPTPARARTRAPSGRRPR